MNILQKANQFFRENNYAKALELFEQAGVVYGPKLVRANILLCKKALEQEKFKSTAQQNLDPIPVFQIGPADQSTLLDPATRYMLCQMGQLELTEGQKQQCLEQHKRLTSRKSEDAEVKTVNPIPADWPKDLVLAPLPESTNDFKWHLARKARRPKKEDTTLPGLSVIIPTFNRSKILDVTLACLVNQVTQYPFEVIVADDGSYEDINLVIRRYEPLLDIKYVRQKDYGFQVSAVRNLGMRACKYDLIAFLDCDMAPNTRWVESYMALLSQDDDIAVVGPRKYVDTLSLDPIEFLKNKHLIEQLPEVRTNNKVAGKDQGEISIDWRLSHFQKSQDLRLCDFPFRYFAAGNIAFAKKWLKVAGWFDEDFSNWGGEDIEMGYRLFRHGCFFRVVWDAMAYHQEPPGSENETDRSGGKKITDPIKNERIPYFYRKVLPLNKSKIFKNPLVSIYIPAFNCESSIIRCVDSALNQSIVDLEVCICNDGSTDRTLEVLNQHYENNPRVRIMTQANGGIGRASNSAMKMTRGYYIGQLDSDDYLEPDAVELCLKEFLADSALVCVYTTYRNVDSANALIKNGYNWPIFSREKLTTAMIAHHFRMFTVRAWHLTEGFDESIANAVDYDMYLKLSEVGPFKHINKISYNRVLHGENTSIKKLDAQKQNHFRSVNKSLFRQTISHYEYTSINKDDPACRSYYLKKKEKETPKKKPMIGILKFSVLSKKEINSWISSRERSWDEHVASILDSNRLNFRTEILLNGLLKQISLQTIPLDQNWFKLIIVISTLLPSQYKSKLYLAAKHYPWLDIIERGPDEWIGAEAIITEALVEMMSGNKSQSISTFMSFRLDDDDFLPVDYVERCQSHIKKENINKFVTFPLGAKILWTKDSIKICNYEVASRPFIAIGLGVICAFDSDRRKIISEIKSVFVGVNHYKIKDSFDHIIDNSSDMFLWSHHHSQDTFGRFKSVEFKGTGFRHQAIS